MWIYGVEKSTTWCILLLSVVFCRMHHGIMCVMCRTCLLTASTPTQPGRNHEIRLSLGRAPLMCPGPSWSTPCDGQLREESLPQLHTFGSLRTWFSNPHLIIQGWRWGSRPFHQQLRSAPRVKRVKCTTSTLRVVDFSTINIISLIIQLVRVEQFLLAE